MPNFTEETLPDRPRHLHITIRKDRKLRSFYALEQMSVGFDQDYGERVGRRQTADRSLLS